MADAATDTAARAHSWLAPSSMKRIIACGRSVLFTQSLPQAPRRASVFAAEGTVAHTVMEALVTGAVPPAVGTVVSQEGHEITVDDEMIEAAAMVADLVADLCARDPRAVVFVERTVRLDAVLGPEADCYGHLDICVWLPSLGELHIIDFKYGKGVAVAAQENPQLLTYALGAFWTILTDRQRGLVQTVALHVVQPRIHGAPPVQTDTFALLDVMIWGDHVLRPAVDRIVSGAAANDPFVSGEHCRFCPALAHCPAMHQRATETAKRAFGAAPTQPSALTDDQLAHVLDDVDIIQPWMDAVRAEAHARAETQGARIPGWKLVPKRGSRVWKGDQTEIAAALRCRLGLDHGAITTEPVLRSPAQVERLIPKSDRAARAAFEQLWEMRSSGTSLARDTDPRPAVQAARAGDVFAPVSDSGADSFSLDSPNRPKE